MHTPASSRPIRVLVADAEPLIRWALAETLVARGCVVTDAPSSAATLQLLSRPHPDFDVILLDHCISETHDLTLLEATAALAPRSRIIMLTACMPLERAAEAYRCGATAIVEKPVDLDAVVALVMAPAGRG